MRILWTERDKIERNGILWKTNRSYIACLKNPVDFLAAQTHRMNLYTCVYAGTKDLQTDLASKSLIYQQTHFISVLENIKIYNKTYIKIAPTCFSLRPSSGSLHMSLAKITFIKSVKVWLCGLCSCVAACHIQDTRRVPLTQTTRQERQAAKTEGYTVAFHRCSTFLLMEDYQQNFCFTTDLYFPN